MYFKKEDFSNSFISKCREEELNIILDFCNCYYIKFGKYISREEIIQRIEMIDCFEYYNDENSNAMASHNIQYSAGGTKIDSLYIRINSSKWNIATIEEKKAILYHELIYHFSTKEIKGQEIQSGLRHVYDREISYLDEVMTEYYANELLRIDNIDLEKNHKTVTTINPKLDRSEEYITSKGEGYIFIAGLGQMYDRILGKRIFDGKMNDYLEFKDKFDTRFREIGENPRRIINEELKQAYYSQTKTSIYNCYRTALKVFNIDRRKAYEKDGFDLYDYLKKSHSVMKSLPTKEMKDLRMDKGAGIPEELFSVLTDIDKEIIIKYIKPDIMEIQDETLRNSEINRIVSVINILRENISTLSREDIENISYGKIEEYTHSGRDCLIIKAGNNSFQTFANNSEEANYQFMPYCTFKAPGDYDEIYNTDINNQIIQNFQQSGISIEDEYKMSVIMNIGGIHGSYGLVESNGKYFTTSGPIKEVQISEIQKLTPQTTEKEIISIQTRESSGKSNSTTTSQERLAKKMEWIRGFIQDYEATEKHTSYAFRVNCEDKNIQTVLQSIQTGIFNGDYDNTANQNIKNKGYMSYAITAMARLLKEADNLTIEGGEDYLERFASIPEINQILLQIKASEEFKQMHSEAETNRLNKNIPNFKKTKAEIDKQSAQEYLTSENLSQNSIENEIKYRKILLSGNIIRVSDETEEDKIPLVRRQQIALTRILARQDGKVPGDIEYDEKIGWYCKTDTQNESIKTGIQNTISNIRYISPKDIYNSVFKAGIAGQEINGVIQEMRQTQTKDLQQAQVK